MSQEEAGAGRADAREGILLYSLNSMCKGPAVGAKPLGCGPACCCSLICQSHERKWTESPRTLAPPPAIKAVVCRARHGSSLLLAGGLSLDGQDLEWGPSRQPESLRLPGSTSGFGCLLNHGKSDLPRTVVCSRNPVLTTSETQRREAVCLGSHSTAVHRQGRPGVELGVYLQGYWWRALAPWPLGLGRGTWSVASQDAVSGPQANVTVWEGSLLESQVAELPATKPYWRTERAHEGGVQTCRGSLQLDLQVTPSPGTKASSTLSLLQRRGGQSKMQPAPQNGCLLRLCPGGLSPPPSHISQPGPQGLSL